MSSWVRDKQLYESRISPAGSRSSSRQQGISTSSPRPQAKPPSKAASQQSPRLDRPVSPSPAAGGDKGGREDRGGVREDRGAGREGKGGREDRGGKEDRRERQQAGRRNYDGRGGPVQPLKAGVETSAKLTSVELKRAELSFKQFANRMELMPKKALQEYFHLNDLQGSQIVDRLFFAFGKTNSIDFASFAEAISVLAKGSPSDRSQFLFRMLDLKGTSLIDRNDLKKMLLSYLNAALSIELDQAGLEELQEEVKGESAQDIEQAVDELVEKAVGTYGSHGNFLTLEEFTAYLLSDPLIFKSLSL